MLDGETHEIIDVLEGRHKHFLCDYFKHIPESERNNVKYVVGDLWETYSDIAFTYFRKAKYIADHFHFIRYAITPLSCNELISQFITEFAGIFI